MELDFHLNIFKELEFHNFFYLFKSLVRYNSIVQKSSFKLKLDFKKIKFQNMGISLKSFKHEHFAGKFWRKGQMPILATRYYKVFTHLKDH